MSDEQQRGNWPPTPNGARMLLAAIIAFISLWVTKETNTPENFHTGLLYWVMIMQLYVVLSHPD
ncbi:hypothetical protein LCGC14_1446120 [marine sediment metagenome]|uniref:Uncharacterized protein n=1 Tax=marine sediment metagenome TaxID=412755 RepID=A0A0F9K5G8_9ZZZZ